MSDAPPGCRVVDGRVLIPCFCQGHNPGCLKCDGTGTIAKPACRRCGGRGNQGGARCLDCRGYGWRSLDADLIFDDPSSGGW